MSTRNHKSLQFARIILLSTGYMFKNKKFGYGSIMCRPQCSRQINLRRLNEILICNKLYTYNIIYPFVQMTLSYYYLFYTPWTIGLTFSVTP